jgi:hypothetical protein
MRFFGRILLIRFVQFGFLVIFHQTAFSAGHRWNSMNEGLENLNIQSICLPDTNSIMAGTSTGIFVFSKSTKVWSKLLPGLRYPITSLISVSDSVIIAGTEYRSRYTKEVENAISIDAGKSWSLINIGHPGYVIQDICVNGSGDVYAAVRFVDYLMENRSYIIHSSDSGHTWETIGSNPNGFRSIAVYNSTILVNGFTINPDVPATVPPSGNLLRSDDRGLTWNAVTVSEKSWTTVMDLAFNNRGIAFAGTNDSGLFQSTDQGLTWKQMRTLLPDNFIVSLNASNDRSLYVGTYSQGFFSSSNMGMTWLQDTLGMGIVSISSIITDSTGSQLIVGTNGEGVYSSTLTDNPVDSSEDPTRQLSLHNYPNPFNHSTTIEYSLPRAGTVRLDVYNLLGQKLTCLLEEYQEAGIHIFNWIPRGLSSGIYCCALAYEDHLFREKISYFK